MPSQNDFRIMQALQPVCLLTRRPTEDAMAVYCEKLSRFPLDTLKSAVERITETWDRATFPPLAVFMKECGVCGINHTSMKMKTESDTLSWNERDASRSKMMIGWRNEFLQSPLYRQAEQEGWSSRLYRYANAIAWIQAQIIYPDVPGNIGWEHYATQMEPDIREVIKTQRSTCASSHINIEIDARLIEGWKAWRFLEKEHASMATEGMARKYGVPLSEPMKEVAQNVTTYEHHA